MKEPGKALFDLSHRKALVTGGGRGIGLGITKALCMAGAEVVIVGSSARTKQHAEELSAQMHGKVSGICYDLQNLDGLEQLFQQAQELLGGQVDILVNNAGIQRRYDADEFPLEELKRVIDINQMATYLLCQLAARQMKPRRYGKIINMASMTSFFGSYRISAYACSKGAIAQMTKAFSNEWAPYGINVNAIAPGGFRTEMTEALWNNSEADRQAMERTPYGRWGTEEDIMGTVIYLASHASDYVCGAILPVDGGYLVR